MRITPVFTPYYSNKNVYNPKQTQQMSNPAFGSTARFNILSYDDYLYATASNMFKGDIPWLDFAADLDNHFADKEKVNVICQACSDGSEPYTLGIALIETLGEEGAKKFFPLKAFDIDKENIENAQTGLINLLEDDIKQMNKLGIDIDKYFAPTDKRLMFREDELNGRTVTYEVKPILRDNVIFKRESVEQTLNNLEDESNTVFLCRNVIPYFGSYDSKKTIENIGRTLAEGSIFSMGNFVNGNFGRSRGDNDLIKDSGFKDWHVASRTFVKVCNGVEKNPYVGYLSDNERFYLYHERGIDTFNR